LTHPLAFAVGLDVQFGAFLAIILGLFIPVVFLVTL
jgi:photosystem II PsbM protein